MRYILLIMLTFDVGCSSQVNTPDFYLVDKWVQRIFRYC